MKKRVCSTKTDSYRIRVTASRIDDVPDLTFSKYRAVL